MSRGRYFVSTFGCRVNQADSQGIEHALESIRLARSESHADADVVVINTCTVTHRSDADVRKLVNRIQRENPAAQVVVTGCYAERDPAALASLPGTAAVIGNRHRDEVGDIVDRLLDDRDACGSLRATPVVVHTAIEALLPEDLPPLRPVASVSDRTRPFVKIQDGCDASCTYCVIPSVRGRARSAHPTHVLEIVESLVRQGYFEIVLAGVHLGTYGSALDPSESLAGLVRRLLEIDGLGRLRMSCIEPMAFPLALAELAASNPKLAPHFHLPLQSGCDRVLKRMGRPYRSGDFADVIRRVRALLPEACLGTDVIVGFPGETEGDFDETSTFISNAGLDYVHVFSYSDRPGVASTKLPEKVEPRIIKERSTKLHQVGAGLWRRFLDRQVGKDVDAITLERDVRSPEVIQALSAAFCPIQCQDPILEPNRPVRVRIASREGDFLIGSAVPA